MGDQTSLLKLGNHTAENLLFYCVNKISYKYIKRINRKTSKQLI